MFHGVVRLEDINKQSNADTMADSSTGISHTQQLEAVHMKYGGTGNADMSKYEWLTNQHRDTYASLVGHHSQVAFHSIAENQSFARTRAQYLTRMVLPCGPPPPVEEKKKQ